ncbi:MAG: hemolysin family protein [Actinomycetota bacterium]
MDGALGLGLVLLLITIHGLFVAGEFGVVAVDRSKIEQLAEDEGHRRARSVLKALKTLSFQLSGAQLGITITSLLVGFLIEPAIAPLLEPVAELIGLGDRSAIAVSVTVALILATSFEMVMAELVPKNLAIARPLPTAFAIAGPLRFTNLLMKPLIVFLNASANATVRLLGIEPREELTSVYSLGELRVMIRSSREGGTLEEEEASLLVRSINFGEKTAAEALVPRVSIDHVTRDQTLTELTQLALESGHSRFPVAGDNVDDIVGIANVKDVYATPPEDRSKIKVEEIMRDTLIVPETRDLASLLLDLRRERKHMAIAIDEYGGTAGIVTVEDVLEELVGEIEDEYDSAEAGITVPQGSFVVSGMLHRDEVAELTRFVLPDGDYDTLAGFLLTLFDRIPEQGEHISYDGWEFKVIEMEKNRIAKVLLVAPAPRLPSEEDER